MPTTIFDSSLITQRNKNKAIANSFISRIQNPSPVNGSAPLLGITAQSLINSVVNGQSVFYRKTDSGCTSVNLGCPCTAPSVVSITTNTFNAPNISVVSFSINTCILGFTFPTSGTGFVITSVTTDPSTPLPSGWSILSFNNSQIVLIKSDPNPASIPNPGIKFIFSGASGEITNSSNFVTGIQTAGLNSNYWATNMGISGSVFVNGIASDTDGNFYLTGRFNSPTFEVKNYSTISSGTIITSTYGILTNSGGGFDVYLIKYNSFGQAQWATTITGAGTDFATAITTYSNTQVIITGFFNSDNISVNDFNSVDSITKVVNVTPFGTIDRTGINNDAFLVSYNASNGTALGGVRIGSVGSGSEEPVAVCTDLSGNIYIAGSTNSTSLSGITISNYGGVSGGGIIQVPTWGILSKTSSGFAVFIVKYDISGQAQWATLINKTGTASTRANDMIYDVTTDSIYILANSPSSVVIQSFVSRNPDSSITLSSFGTLTLTSQSTYIVKYNASGLLQGQAQFVTSITGGSTISNLIGDNLGNIYVSGYSNITSGFIINNSAGGINVTPYATLPASSSINTDSYIVKYDNTGQTLWGTTISANYNNGILDITSDGTYIYVIGFFISSTISVNDYDTQSGGIITVTPYGSLSKDISVFNYYIAKYDNAGQAKWATRLDARTTTANPSARITLDPSGNVCVTGFYDVNPLAISAFDNASGGIINVTPYANLPTSGTNSIFTIKLNSSGQFI